MSLVESRAALRNRLMTPPNGRVSDELEIISDNERRLNERETRYREAAEAQERARVNRKWENLLALKEKVDALERQELEWIKRLSTSGLRIHSIIDLCCIRYKFRPLEILGQRRQAQLCHVRHIVCFLCCELTNRSLPEIGLYLGKRDHSTILHARNKIKRMVAADPEFAAEIAELKAALEPPA
jgi:chromosomal replication initiation ATPase DnaA